MWRSRNYIPIRILGAGFQSTVWLAKEKRAGELVTIKSTEISDDAETGGVAQRRHLLDERRCLEALAKEINVVSGLGGARESNEARGSSSHGDLSQATRRVPSEPSIPKARSCASFLGTTKAPGFNGASDNQASPWVPAPSISVWFPWPRTAASPHSVVDTPEPCQLRAAARPPRLAPDANYPTAVPSFTSTEAIGTSSGSPPPPGPTSENRSTDLGGLSVTSATGMSTVKSSSDLRSLASSRQSISCYHYTTANLRVCLLRDVFFEPKISSPDLLSRPNGLNKLPRFDPTTSSDAGGRLHFVLQFVPGCPLNRHIAREGGFSEEKTKFFTAELIRILGALHERGYVYRDLKASNIIVQPCGRLTLIDFGFAKYIGRRGRTVSFCGTPHSMAPEIYSIQDLRRSRTESLNVPSNDVTDGGKPVTLLAIDKSVSGVPERDKCFDNNRCGNPSGTGVTKISGTTAPPNDHPIDSRSPGPPCSSTTPVTSTGTNAAGKAGHNGAVCSLERAVGEMTTPTTTIQSTSTDCSQQPSCGSTGEYGREVDWWSLGVLVYEILYTRPPFGFRDYECDSSKTIAELAAESPDSLSFPERPRFPPLSPGACAFIKSLLQPNPRLRSGRLFDSRELEQMKWFEGFPWQCLDDPLSPGPAVYQFQECDF